METKAKKSLYFSQRLENFLTESANVLKETELAVIVSNKYPKAQYHYLVIPKEHIDNVTELKQKHLPLLDHMLELANEIIGMQDHLPANCFLMGFKVDDTMTRLHMHVISKDFYSERLRRPRQWNVFNTELFHNFRATYDAVRDNKIIEPFPLDKIEILLNALPLKCNYENCDFSSDLMLNLKIHLADHWHFSEAKRKTKQQVAKTVKLLEYIGIKNKEQLAVEITSNLPSNKEQETNQSNGEAFDKSPQMNQPYNIQQHKYHQNFKQQNQQQDRNWRQVEKNLQLQHPPMSTKGNYNNQKFYHTLPSWFLEPPQQQHRHYNNNTASASLNITSNRNYSDSSNNSNRGNHNPKWKTNYQKQEGGYQNKIEGVNLAQPYNQRSNPTNPNWKPNFHKQEGGYQNKIQGATPAQSDNPRSNQTNPNWNFHKKEISNQNKIQGASPAQSDNQRSNQTNPNWRKNFHKQEGGYQNKNQLAMQQSKQTNANSTGQNESAISNTNPNGAVQNKQKFYKKKNAQQKGPKPFVENK